MSFHGWLENGPGLKMYFTLNMVIGPMPFGLFFWEPHLEV